MNSHTLFIIAGFFAAFTVGWSFADEQPSPTTAFLAFHSLILNGEVEKSKDCLSNHTLDVLADIKKGLEESQAKFGKISNDPLSARIANELMSDMHMSTDPSQNDVWRSLLAEAAESENEPWMTSGLKVTSEEIKGSKAVLTVENSSYKQHEVMVLEDGTWKVELPYVCQIALGGWQLDLANYMSKVEALQTMARDVGVNANKSDGSVREIVKKL
jgi:hypothetical protein